MKDKLNQFSTTEGDVNLALVYDSIVFTTCKDYITPMLALSYNKGEIGDKDGRKRLRALKELKYIKNRYDPESSFRSYPSEEIDAKCLKDAKLPGNHKFSKHMERAIEAFKDEFRVGSSDIVDEFINHLHSSSQMINDIRDLAKMKLEEAKQEGDLVIAKDCMAILKDANSAIKAIPDILKELNKAKDEERKQLEFKTASKDKTSFEINYMQDWITAQL